MNVTFTAPTNADVAQMDGIDLSGRIKITATDGVKHGHTYMLISIYNKLGVDYIIDHIELNYSDFLEEWCITISENDYYNDQNRNPDKTIHVEFIDTDGRTGNEIYKDVNSGRYWMRQVSNKEDFAKWFVCGYHFPRIEEGNEPRPNLIFVNGSQREKVTYHDWNGTAAYSNTFNRSFR